MTQNIIAYFSTLTVFLFIDFIWLSIIAKDYYYGQLGPLMLDKVNLPVALLFYALYCIGIVLFVVNPALKLGDWQHALLYGALFGFFAYATYDLTNLATLKQWPAMMSFIDIIWGSFLTSLSATIGFFLTRFIISQI